MGERKVELWVLSAVSVLILCIAATTYVWPSDETQVSKCTMTYMWPSYEQVDMGNRSVGGAGYELYYYSEGRESPVSVRATTGLIECGNDSRGQILTI